MSVQPLAHSAFNNDVLLKAAQSGDRAAFGRLAEVYRPYLMTVASRVLAEHVPSDGSDVVQTAFGIAFEHLGQFHGQESTAFLGWLATITRNEALRVLHKAGRLQTLPRGLADEQWATDSSEPDVRASHREQAARLVAAIEQLPEDYRTVLSLRNLQELPYEVVAQRMGRSSVAVRKLWTRAMERLRQELGDEP